MVTNESKKRLRQNDTPHLGRWIRAARANQGLSQRELADRAGLSRSYVCDIERGRGTNPSVESLDKLAAALGFTRVDLLQAAGLIESPDSRGSDEEHRMVAIFRDLTDNGRGAVLRFARFVHAEEHHWVQETFLTAPADNDDRLERTGMAPLFDLLEPATRSSSYE